jgi:hypothetical protein
MPGTTIFAGLPTKLRLLSNHSDIREVRVATNIAHVVLTRYSTWGFLRGAGLAFASPKANCDIVILWAAPAVVWGGRTIGGKSRHRHVAAVEHGRHYPPFIRGGPYVGQSSKAEM